FAQIFGPDRYLGKLDRLNGEKQLLLPPCAEGTRLDILVEAMGRINFGRAIKDFKGITDNVTVTEDRNGHSFVCDLKDWEVFNLEDSPGFYESMEYFPVGAFTPGADGRLPRGVYRGTFNVDKPSDTFLNFETWGKGLVYVNGHPLGRIWEIGPQQTLYMPGCWLRKGENEIMVFDVIGPREAVSQGLDAPLLNTLRLDREGNLHNKAADRPDINLATPVAEGRLSDGNGWQTVRFGSPAKGRYLVLEVLSNHDGGDVTAIAEMYALGSDGQRLSREPWKAKYADSEDVSQGNNTLDKVFDLQESTYWQTAPSAKLPHLMVIDLGGEHTLTGIDYLPRAEQGAPGSVNAYRLYLIQ
ncbi:MAG: discoidin domain-containing protein, partial [Muribaculaceae bacterium]|nr:discoidin domain-containing protein [Muribaculaceae bacterium]